VKGGGAEINFESSKLTVRNQEESADLRARASEPFLPKSDSSWSAGDRLLWGDHRPSTPGEHLPNIEELESLERPCAERTAVFQRGASGPIEALEFASSKHFDTN
jgi:hypothetical protein